jgi:hypothetical protein
MGCWDVFCCICGNPLKVEYTLNGINDFIKEIYNSDKINSSYSSTTKKLIKKIKLSKNIINDLNDLNKTGKWMNKCTMLLVNNQVIHNLTEISCNINFCNKKICTTHIGSWTGTNECSYKSSSNCGIIIHTDCWKFIKKNYKINLNFNMLPKLEYYNHNKNFNINYGDIEKYWNQEFNFCELLLDNKKYLCSSPLNNDKNIKQIKKNINYFKFKHDPKRIGPYVSATFYNDGDIKIGKNKYFWIKKNNKWTQINEKPINITIKINTKKINKKQSSFLDTLPFIGQYNINPIFIISSTGSNNTVTLELVLIESYKNKLSLINII